MCNLTFKRIGTVQQHKGNQLYSKRYIVWDNETDKPIDQFQVYRFGVTGDWYAWCLDTYHVHIQEMRKVFAATLKD
jgi:hypothetical protein